MFQNGPELAGRFRLTMISTLSTTSRQNTFATYRRRAIWAFPSPSGGAADGWVRPVRAGPLAQNAMYRRNTPMGLRHMLQPEMPMITL